MAIEPLKSLYIFADIETDSLQVNKILQIAAITETGEQFNIHLNPKAELPISCTNITGLYFHKGNLYKNGRQVPSVSIQKGLRNNAHDALADSIALKEICISFTKSQNLDLHEFLDLYKKPTEHFFKLEQERIKKNGGKR